MLKWISVLLAALMLIVVIAWWFLSHPSLSSISKFAPLWFPDDAVLISSYDNGVTSISAMVSFSSKRDLETFIETNQMRINPLFKNRIDRVCTENHAIDVSIDWQKLEIQLKVQYPDWAGLDPCP